MPGSGIVGLYGNSTSSFWGTAVLFSIVAAPTYIPTNSGRVFSTPSLAFIVYRFFDDSRSD